MKSTNSLECMIGAQEVIAKWHEGHGKWEIKRWRCVPKEKLSTSI